jgi:hypothetical protein
MLAGRFPFEGSNQLATLHLLTAGLPPPPLPKVVPPVVEEIVRRALAHDASARFATAAEMHAAFEEALKEADVATSVHDLAAYVAEHAAARTATRKEAIALAIKSAAERSRVAALLDAHADATAVESAVTAPGVGEASVGTLATASLDTLEERVPKRKVARTWIASGTAAGVLLGLAGWAVRWAHPTATAPTATTASEVAPPPVAPETTVTQAVQAVEEAPSAEPTTEPAPSPASIAAAAHEPRKQPAKHVSSKPKPPAAPPPPPPAPRKRKTVDDGF